MLFSCLVDADFRDTEKFYCTAEGRVADRDWPELPRIVDDLIARFDHYMTAKQATADDTPVNHLRGEILAHVRRRAASDRGLFTLTVPTRPGLGVFGPGVETNFDKSPRQVFGYPEPVAGHEEECRRI